METDYLIGYLGKFVKIILINDYFYKGKILDVGKDSISILDINNKRVTLSFNSILMIEEVLK